MSLKLLYHTVITLMVLKRPDRFKSLVLNYVDYLIELTSNIIDKNTSDLNINLYDN